jgi:hypothetical protein
VELGRARVQGEYSWKMGLSHEFENRGWIGSLVLNLGAIAKKELRLPVFPNLPEPPALLELASST